MADSEIHTPGIHAVECRAGSPSFAKDSERKPDPTVSTGLSRAQGALLVWLALLLASAVVLQILPDHGAAVIRREMPLADYFPRETAGWHSEDRPLAETASELAAVCKILNYDEALLRIYRKGGQEFTLYTAYWRPGKMPAREIDFHVPEVCWVMAGWKECAANYHYQREFEGRPLAPAQYRELESPQERQHVLYWHILDGHAVSFSSDSSHNQLDTLGNVFRRGFNQKGEQYFIRIASRSSLDDLWNDEGFQEIMELIAPLGPGLHSSVDRF